MIRYSFFVGLILLITPLLYAQDYNRKNLSVGFEAKNKDFYEFEKLRLYPVYAKDLFLKHKLSIGKYVPLQKALTEKKIVISEINTTNDSLTFEQTTERQRENIIRNRARRENNQTRNNTRTPVRNGESVNTLSIQNISKDTIYIMAGEIVQGGKQDRVIAQDIILPPMGKPIDLSVFCVEQGRWKYDEKNPKDNKNFEKYYGTASLKLRSKIEKEKNQQSVWSEVTRSNNENNTKTETQAYTAQINNKDFKQNHQKYVDYFQKNFPKNREIIGVIVVTGDKVVGADMFATSQLFETQFESLLTSYINEAITDGSLVNINNETVRSYVDNLLDDEKQKVFLEKNGKKFEHNKKNFRLSTF